MSDLKERAKLVDDRLKVLIKKYPLVFTASVLIGVAIGVGLCLLF